MLQNSRIGLRKSLKCKSDAPAAMRVWCMPAPSLTNPEEREFVVDSGASMHIFVSVKLLEDTPAVLSPGKLCEEHG